MTGMITMQRKISFRVCSALENIELYQYVLVILTKYKIMNSFAHSIDWKKADPTYSDIQNIFRTVMNFLFKSLVGLQWIVVRLY